MFALIGGHLTVIKEQKEKFYLRGFYFVFKRKSLLSEFCNGLGKQLVVFCVY